MAATLSVDNQLWRSLQRCSTRKALPRWRRGRHSLCLMRVLVLVLVSIVGHSRACSRDRSSKLDHLTRYAPVHDGDSQATALSSLKTCTRGTAHHSLRAADLVHRSDNKGPKFTLAHAMHLSVSDIGASRMVCSAQWKSPANENYVANIIDSTVTAIITDHIVSVSRALNNCYPPYDC